MDLTPRALLFVPANRPERFEKAASSGADAIILDCEDAVAPEMKDVARRALRADFTDLPVYVRINGIGTQWHDDDLRLVAAMPDVGIIIPKAEAGEIFARIASMPKWHGKVIALIETAQGLSQARQIAAMPGISFLAFGSVDFSADCGCAHTRTALQSARSELVISSRLAGLGAPIDGVTTTLADEDLAEDDARYAVEMGFGGKLCIHPRQIAPVLRGLKPSGQEIEWANKVLQAGPEASALNGGMIDRAVQLRARSILERAQPSDFAAN